jgi:hypothetical protein
MLGGLRLCDSFVGIEVTMINMTIVCFWSGFESDTSLRGCADLLCIATAGTD